MQTEKSNENELMNSDDAISGAYCFSVASWELSPLRSTSFQHAVTNRERPLIASGTQFAAHRRAFKATLADARMLSQLWVQAEQIYWISFVTRVQKNAVTKVWQQ
jgi:hypothetical protein